MDGPRFPTTTLERDELHTELLSQLVAQSIAQTKLLARMVAILEPFAKLAHIRFRIGK